MAITKYEVSEKTDFRKFKNLENFKEKFQKNSVARG